MPIYPLQKPRDDNAFTIPHDHEQIEGSELLIRGIPSQQIVNQRISSGAFKSSSDPYKGMSVDLERCSEGIDYTSGKYVGAVKFKVQHPRSKNHWVGYDPILEPEKNLAHSQIWRPPDPSPKRISDGVSKLVHRNAEWYTEIEGVEIWGK